MKRILTVSLAGALVLGTLATGVAGAHQGGGAKSPDREVGPRGGLGGRDLVPSVPCGERNVRLRLGHTWQARRLPQRLGTGEAPRCHGDALRCDRDAHIPHGRRASPGGPDAEGHILRPEGNGPGAGIGDGRKRHPGGCRHLRHLQLHVHGPEGDDQGSRVRPAGRLQQHPSGAERPGLGNARHAGRHAVGRGQGEEAGRVGHADGDGDRDDSTCLGDGSRGAQAVRLVGQSSPVRSRSTRVRRSAPPRPWGSPGRTSRGRPPPRSRAR